MISLNQNNPLHISLQLAEKSCKKNDVRLTKKRRQVLTLLLTTNKAISAYELIELFEADFDEVLLPMTAYRALEFLEEVHLAHRLNTANKYVACAHISCDAHHELPHFLICQQCLCVDELNDSHTNNLSDLTSQAEQTGYQLTSPQIELNGICNKCLSTNNNA